MAAHETRSYQAQEAQRMAQEAVARNASAANLKRSFESRRRRKGALETLQRLMPSVQLQRSLVGMAANWEAARREAEKVRAAVARQHDTYIFS